jgi:hypothetical protein
MTDNPNLWEVRKLPDGLTLELWAWGNPALVLAQGERWVAVDLPHVKGVVTVLVDAGADLAELLATVACSFLPTVAATTASRSA